MINQPGTEPIYYFRSDGFTVRDTVEGLNAQCQQCGDLIQFSPHARPLAIDTDLREHRKNHGQRCADCGGFNCDCRIAREPEPPLWFVLGEA